MQKQNFGLWCIGFLNSCGYKYCSRNWVLNKFLWHFIVILSLQSVKLYQIENDRTKRIQFDKNFIKEKLDAGIICKMLSWRKIIFLDKGASQLKFFIQLYANWASVIHTPPWGGVLVLLIFIVKGLPNWQLICLLYDFKVHSQPNKLKYLVN